MHAIALTDSFQVQVTAHQEIQADVFWANGASPTTAIGVTPRSRSLALSTFVRLSRGCCRVPAPNTESND